MRIAVIGTGIAGNVAAYMLAGDHELTVFEQNPYVGGHTSTVAVEAADGPVDVDTGFIVFNEEKYPNFTTLLTRLGVTSQPTNMSFSVQVHGSGLEYSNRAFFARRRNALSPSFYRMIADIVRFNKMSRRLLLGADDSVLLGPFLDANNYSRAFALHFLYPMGAALWSSDPRQMREFPARYFAQYFTNHRFLDVLGQPEWRVIKGGSHRYVDKLTAGFRDRIRLGSPVTSVRRTDQYVEVNARGNKPERFDHVIIAAHGDQALSMLADPTPKEREVLGSFRFQENETVLHTDVSVLPRRRAVWSAWNAYVPEGDLGKVAVTYDMNLLMGLRTKEEYLVTLNRTQEIDPKKVLRTFSYHHPVYSREAVAAQKRHREISGTARTHFCGAYWGFGFHEDGVNSGLAVASHFGKKL